MLLAVDIGNSQTSFGVFRGEKLVRHWRAQTVASRTSDEIAALLFPLLVSSGLENPAWDGVAICSVVPAAERSFRQFSESYLKTKPFVVRHDMKKDFSLNVDFPNEVGADRLANVAYAVRFFTLPAVVVDIGTATTFDVISRERVYEGGLILPGPRLCVEALSKNTAQLTSVDLRYPDDVVGKNTVDCIRSGILYGYCDLVDGLLGRLEKKLGPASVALTGGMAALLVGKIHRTAESLPDLTLHGIRLCYEANV